MTKSNPDAAGSDANGPSRGAFYVGARAAGAPEGPQPGGVTRECVHCGQLVWIGSDDVALADSCAAVACSDCTGTPDGILYIAP
jgi:hypothetical protein